MIKERCRIKVTQEHINYAGEGERHPLARAYADVLGDGFITECFSDECGLVFISHSDWDEPYEHVISSEAPEFGGQPIEFIDHLPIDWIKQEGGMLSGFLKRGTHE